MADSATQSVEQVEKITLRVMVDKEKNKVVYAEAGKDFYDVLLSFLTLPLGTIARLVSEESNIEAVQFGSISSLYQSVSDLDQQYLFNQTCKEMLLNPRNSMEAYCQKLVLNIDNTEPLKHFVCKDWNCTRKESGNCLSIFRNQKCKCGDIMDTVLSPPLEYVSLEHGFVKETATFIISDDLSMMPNVFGTFVHLLQKLEITNVGALEEQTVDISKIEVVDILKLSLVSKTPLTDFIFKKKHLCDEFDERNQTEFKNGEASSEEGRKMSIKVLRRKSTGEILFVEGGVDFIDFVFSFLTFPLGGVLHMLQGFSSLSCIDNLYRSITELSPDTYLMSQELKDKLTTPPIAAQFELSNPTLPISAATLPVYYCHIYFNSQWIRTLSTRYKHYDSSNSYGERCVLLSFVDLKYSASSSICGEFAKGPLIYMVRDDLVVTPMSSFNAISHLNSSNVPVCDVEEKVVRIGVNEGLSILKASLTSASALSNGLNQFLTTIKEEICAGAVAAFRKFFVR